MRTIIEGNVNHIKTFYDDREPIILWDKIAMLYFIIIISNLDANRNGLETWNTQQTELDFLTLRFIRYYALNVKNKRRSRWLSVLP